MADLRVTYFERQFDSGLLEEIGREDFEENTAPQAAQRAFDAAEKWIDPDRRNRTYRIDRLLPPD